jgi:hypothetical protein
MGVSFDVTGSYGAALALFACALLVSSGLIALMGPYRYPTHAAPAGAVHC